ncbi:hypothetical protein BDV27DRAFT_130498 [Aspergillus caelatus]|uniref:Uncharacterized protein n=1 Tax=Aspergillus caelatus TaxID=61420 RepID=A0A5N7A095_9EURO|nr:uncharacterized protein BDV27DRAFT_130498 [Aspergillus caelatus]KAE8363105.1 hypothetical protein BDV27DRAFT_130498 [Aspergillus caelatus]
MMESSTRFYNSIMKNSTMVKPIPYVYSPWLSKVFGYAESSNFSYPLYGGFLAPTTYLYISQYSYPYIMRISRDRLA